MKRLMNLNCEFLAIHKRQNLKLRSFTNSDQLFKTFVLLDGEFAVTELQTLLYVKLTK